MKVLYIGSLNKISNSYKRFKTLDKIGIEAQGIDTDLFIYRGNFVKFHHHLNIGPGVNKLNKEMINQVISYNPDVIYVDNKPFLTSASLKWIKKNYPALKIVNVITDDPFGKYGRSWRLGKSTAKYYDIHFVQRTVNIEELKKCGARHVEICYRSYDPELHRPVEFTKSEYEQYHSSVGFIGTHEENREESIAYLIKSGIPVKVVGNDWPGCKNWDIIKPHYIGPSIYGDAYTKHINGMDIALHFLRHANRDEQDSRSFEIPACRVFMIAERSEVHLSLFRENQEAVYFSSNEELLDKVTFYLHYKELREQIAQSAYKRSLNDGYSHEGRLKNIFEKIKNLS